jgi:hypothetical protein
MNDETARKDTGQNTSFPEMILHAFNEASGEAAARQATPD